MVAQQIQLNGKGFLCASCTSLFRFFFFLSRCLFLSWILFLVWLHDFFLSLSFASLSFFNFNLVRIFPTNFFTYNFFFCSLSDRVWCAYFSFSTSKAYPFYFHFISRFFSLTYSFRFLFFSLVSFLLHNTIRLYIFVSVVLFCVSEKHTHT